MFEAPAFYAFVQTLPCSIAGKRDHVCWNPDGQTVNDAHHIINRSQAGSSDLKTVPLCRKAHTECQPSNQRFESKYEVDLMKCRERALEKFFATYVSSDGTVSAPKGKAKSKKLPGTRPVTKVCHTREEFGC